MYGTSIGSKPTPSLVVYQGAAHKMQMLQQNGNNFAPYVTLFAAVQVAKHHHKISMNVAHML